MNNLALNSIKSRKQAIFPLLWERKQISPKWVNVHKIENREDAQIYYFHTPEGKGKLIVTFYSNSRQTNIDFQYYSPDDNAGKDKSKLFWTQWNDYFKKNPIKFNFSQWDDYFKENPIRFNF